MKTSPFRDCSRSFQVILCSLTCVLAGAQTVSFLPPVNVFVPSSSRGARICNLCVAVADFNGDGKPDLAYAYEAQLNFAGVVLGNGDGTFRPGANLKVSAEAGSIWTGDFNGDGKADLAYSDVYAVRTWVALGNGDGTFQSLTQVAACNTVSAVADLNHDGKSDLVCGTSIVLSNGDGTFRPGTNFYMPVLLVADFNHDGNPDLLLTLASGQLTVALGRGDGTFASGLPVATFLAGPIAGDFNGDGKIDLAGTCTKVGLICVLPGTGDGGFGAPAQTIVTASLPGNFTSAGDFNGDGKLDLVSGNAIFPGNGDGTFQTPIFFGTEARPCVPDPEDAVINSCGSQTVTALGADLNDDGLADLVVGSNVNGGQVLTIPLITTLLNDSPGDGFLTPGVSSASYAWPVGPGSIVSAFGVNLAGKIESAPSGTLPTTLGGIRLHVWDNAAGDQLAPLLYVSPTLINYVMPSSQPFPWVSIEHVGKPYVPQGVSVPVSPVGAGFYMTRPALAIGNAITVAPDGSQAIVPVTACSGTVCNSVPVDLTGGPVYLSLYGTGFAQAAAGASACTIGEQNLPITYAGPQMEVAGLDQVNLLLPKSLTGIGAAPVSCIFATQPLPQVGVDSVSSATNPVQITIR